MEETLTDDTTKQSIFSSILASFGINATCTSYADHIGAETYDIALEPGAKISSLRTRLCELQLALKTSLSTLSIITEQGLLRLEIPKRNRPPLNLFEYGSQINSVGGLSCLLGRTLMGEPVWLNVAEAPHTIIAGTTGSGKSTLIHSILANLLMKKDVHTIVFDPKGVDFFPYESYDGIKLVYEYKDAVSITEQLVEEMNERYTKMRKGETEFPYIVLVIDEFADLVSQDYDKQLYRGIRLLAQKSRAARIHIIVATQRPSVNVLDGSLKANFPTRIACHVSNGVDSRVVIDEVGAEKLPTYGSAIMKQGGNSIRFQVAFTTPIEVASYLKGQSRS
jgi:DNA segregation ATPase FtsK/SpoIIIE, S-DNA-T family